MSEACVTRRCPEIAPPANGMGIAFTRSSAASKRADPDNRANLSEPIEGGYAVNSVIYLVGLVVVVLAVLAFFGLR